MNNSPPDPPETFRSAAEIPLPASILPLPTNELLKTCAPVQPVRDCPGIFAHQSTDFFELWAAWEKESGRVREIPYWAVVWPAAAVLARYLIDNPAIVADKTVLDVGCGGGVGGIAARRAGAAVVYANDTDPVALRMAERNAAASGATLRYDLHDYTLDPDACPARVVLICDMFYQRTEAQAMRAACDAFVTKGATVIIADGGRPYAPKTGKVLVEGVAVKVMKDLEGVEQRVVSIRMLQRQDA